MEAVRKEWSYGELVSWMKGGRITRVFLLLLNVALMLTIWLIWRNAPQPDSATEMADVSAAPLQLPASPLRSLSLTNYEEIITRPLFWSDRRALENEATAASTGGNQPLAFVLLGVVMSPESNHALLSKSGSNEVVKVQPGDVVDGWQVESMTANSVRLSRGSEQRAISMDDVRTKPR